MLRTGYTLLITLFLLIGTQVHGEEPAAPEQGAPAEIKAEDAQQANPGPETTPVPSETPAAPDAPAEGNTPSSSSTHLYLGVVDECAMSKDGMTLFPQAGTEDLRAKALELSATLRDTYQDNRPAKNAQNHIEALAKT